MNRKLLKQHAKETVNTHYWKLIIVCAFTMLLGITFVQPFGWSVPTNATPEYSETIQNYNDEGNDFTVSVNDNKISIVATDGFQTATYTFKVPFISNVSSFVSLFAVSTGISIALIAILSLAINLCFFVFLIWMFEIVMNRIFLEARIYEKVPFTHGFNFVTAKTWSKTALANAKRILYTVLWSLTIVGGFIKQYSYLCAPYILAENPNLTGSESITLSRKMMNGHKWEAFVLTLSMLGWYILNAITLGFGGIFYINAYTTAVFTEYYHYIRTLSIENHIEGIEVLNDTYLYEKASEEQLQQAYKSTKMDQMYIEDTEQHPTGFKKFCIETLGILVGSKKEKKIYHGVNNLKAQVVCDIDALDGKQYPNRLAPTYDRENIHFDGNLTENRAYSIPSLVCIFFVISFVMYIFNAGYLNFFMKEHIGFFYGPWLPLSATIAVLSLIFTTKFRDNPIATYVISCVVAALVQYLAGTFSAHTLQATLWSYETNLMAIGTYLCVESILVYGLFCVFVIYVVAPIIDRIVSKQDSKVVTIIAVTLVLLFVLDFIYSVLNPVTPMVITDLPKVFFLQ